MGVSLSTYLNDPQAANGSWYPASPALPGQSSSVPGSTGNSPATPPPTATSTAVKKARRRGANSSYHPVAPVSSVSGTPAMPASGSVSTRIVNFWNNPLVIVLLLVLLLWALV
jgi:hypothetical protein